MIMAKDPAVLFYTSDFLSGTQLMPDGEKGRYITLLCIQHQLGRFTKSQFFTIARETDLDLISKFEIDDEGMYFNKRMQEETEKRKRYSESRRNNRNSNKNKTHDGTHDDTYDDTYDKDMSGHMSPHMENENVNRNIDKGYVADFDKFWAVYPKKKSKDTARRAFKKRYSELPDIDSLIATVSRWAITEDWTKDRGQFVPYAATWINAGGWEDELKGERRQTYAMTRPVARVCPCGRVLKPEESICPVCEKPYA
jgi:superfamily II DNA/RNA helicase